MLEYGEVSVDKESSAWSSTEEITYMAGILVANQPLTIMEALELVHAMQSERFFR